MKPKNFAILILFFTVTNIFSQTNLNSYKYIIVPNKYEFLKENNQYQLNALTEFLFSKYGFTPLMEGSNYPDDLMKNRCLALKSNLIKDSGMFKTKLAIELKNCNDQVVYISELGESREKEYQRAYTEALRDAFKHVEALKYKYDSTTKISTIAVVEDSKVDKEVSKEIQQLREEIQNLKNEKVTEVVEKAEGKEEVVTQLPAKQVIVKEAVVVNTPTIKEVPTSILYAQAIENGFQLVDSSPKVVYKIKKTSIADVYMVENKNATLYKKGNNWILEFYENNILKQEELSIKF